MGVMFGEFFASELILHLRSDKSYHRTYHQLLQAKLWVKSSALWRAEGAKYSRFFWEIPSSLPLSFPRDHTWMTSAKFPVILTPIPLATVTLTQLIRTIICFLGTPPRPCGRHLSITPYLIFTVLRDSVVSANCHRCNAHAHSLSQNWKWRLWSNLPS